MNDALVPRLAPDKRLVVEFDEKRIDRIFSDINQCHLPGAAVGIAIEGSPVYRKGFGLASMELPVVLSPTTRMRIYSATKQFTCLAFMLLCEERKAGIDDPLGKHLPELDAITHHVTMRQLMGNIGGLRDAHDLCWSFSGMEPAVSSDELLSFYRNVGEANFPPGNAWQYSNGGFLLVQAVIERITGQSLARVMCERIFEPVGMYDTLLRPLDTDFVANSATMHMTKSEGGFDRSYEGTVLDGSGGVVSTVDDMLRWLAHMDAPVVGSAATWAIMKTPQMLANGRLTDYGLGLFISNYRNVQTIHHAGSSLGANSHMVKVPAAGLDVTIMVNRHDVSGAERAYQIIDACLSNLGPLPKPSDGPTATGTFCSETTGRIIRLSAASVPLGDAKLRQIVSINGVDLVCEAPDDDGVLRPAALWGGHIRLVGDAESPSSVEFTSQGNQEKLLPVNPPTHTDVSKIVGRYYSQSSDTHAAICQSAEGARLRAVGRFGAMDYELECIGDGLWRATAKPARRGSLRGMLLFNTDHSGYKFSTYSNSSISFRSCT